MTSNEPKHRFVGDAEVGEYWTVRQLFDALCYAIAGIALIVLAASLGGNWWVVLMGVGLIGYGIRIVLGAPTYWVSSWVYAIAVIAVIMAIGALGS